MAAAGTEPAMPAAPGTGPQLWVDRLCHQAAADSCPGPEAVLGAEQYLAGALLRSEVCLVSDSFQWGGAGAVLIPGLVF